MRKIDPIYICNLIGNMSGIPVRLFQNGKQIHCCSRFAFPKDPVCIYLNQLLSINGSVGYYVTPHFNYYGIVNYHKYSFILGPTRQIVNTNQQLREIAFLADVATKDINEFVDIMKGLATMPIDILLQILCSLNYMVNDEKLTIQDVAIIETHQAILKDVLETEHINKNFSELPNDDPVQSARNSINTEETIMRMIRQGNTAFLKQWISSVPSVKAGKLANDELRQIKNTFIVICALAARAGVQGGIEPVDALTLSDSYIQKCEMLNDLSSILNLQYYMVLDYAEHVEKLRQGNIASKLVMDVKNYIYHHISETITVRDIAQNLFIGYAHLSTKFKEESGETLTDFILKEKTEEAKRLLRYTDKPLLAISSYLGFSSQSHFTRVFKTYTNKTPNEYREIRTSLPSINN